LTQIRSVLGYNGVGRLHWRAGPQGGPAAVPGTQIADIEAGLIKTLHVSSINRKLAFMGSGRKGLSING
jgi:hypothetical protein